MFFPRVGARLIGGRARQLGAEGMVDGTLQIVLEDPTALDRSIRDEFVTIATERGEYPEAARAYADAASSMFWYLVRNLDRDLGIILQTHPALMVFGDRDLLVTALRNLIDNAIRYSPENTRVGVGVRTREGVVAVSVTDQGEGLTPEDQERVFERFYRVDAARSRHTGGTGLGLSIVKHVVSNHGGEVTVWSQPGQGSTFTIRLPEMEGQDDDAGLPPSAATAALPPGPATAGAAVGPGIAAGQPHHVNHQGGATGAREQGASA